jgi:hypothetical protein
MQTVRKRNNKIRVVGFASHDAAEFHSLCDVSIRIYSPDPPHANPLSALADTEEYIITELMDALVVMAGDSLGYDDAIWRKGHEDMDPGPWILEKP